MPGGCQLLRFDRDVMSTWLISVMRSLSRDDVGLYVSGMRCDGRVNGVSFIMDLLA